MVETTTQPPFSAPSERFARTLQVYRKCLKNFPTLGTSFGDHKRTRLQWGFTWCLSFHHVSRLFPVCYPHPQNRYYLSIPQGEVIGIHKSWTEYLYGGNASFPEGVDCMLSGFIHYVAPV